MKTGTLLDEVLPDPDFWSRHGRRIEAEPEAVWSALEGYDLSRDASLVVRALVLLRGLRIPRGSPREVLTELGFTVLAERPGREMVVGTTGRFWALRERTNMESPADLDAFTTFARPGWAKAALTFRIEEHDDASTLLVTETRVRCVDGLARRRFAAYWTLIRLFSGLIRREILTAVARRAEGSR